MTDIHKGNATDPSNHGEHIEQSHTQPNEIPIPAVVSPADKNTPSRSEATWRDAREVVIGKSSSKSEAGSPQQSNAQLAGILKPLIQLINERCSNRMAEYPVDRICDVFGDQVFKAEDANLECVMIKLPYDCSYHAVATETVAAILHRTASDEKWIGHLSGEDYQDDPCRGPLRFCLEKKAIWISMLEIFVPALRLKVDAINLDMAAAERQVNELVNYLRAGAPGFACVDEDYMLF